eukprot:3942370-Heterocapsa_arctica.AAC.1
MALAAHTAAPGPVRDSLNASPGRRAALAEHRAALAAHTAAPGPVLDSLDPYPRSQRPRLTAPPV